MLELSAQAAGATLASWYRTGVYRTVITNGVVGPALRRFFLLPDDSQLPMHVGSFNTTAAHPRFPYGYPVEADAPV